MSIVYPVYKLYGSPDTPATPILHFSDLDLFDPLSCAHLSRALYIHNNNNNNNGLCLYGR